MRALRFMCVEKTRKDNWGWETATKGQNPTRCAKTSSTRRRAPWKTQRGVASPSANPSSTVQRAITSPSSTTRRRISCTAAVRMHMGNSGRAWRAPSTAWCRAGLGHARSERSARLRAAALSRGSSRSGMKSSRRVRTALVTCAAPLLLHTTLANRSVYLFLTGERVRVRPARAGSLHGSADATICA